MIVDGLLAVFKLVCDVLLAPLKVIEIGIDFLAGIPTVVSFVNIVAYIIPWSNILPIILLIVGIFGFRIIVSLLKTIWAVLPIL